MGGKKKGGFGVLWIPRKKKHHGHHKPEENRNKSTAFPSSSSHHRHQGAPFMPGDHHGGNSEHLSVRIDRPNEIPTLLNKSFPDEILPIDKEDPNLEKIDEVQPSLSKENSDIPEAAKNSNDLEEDDSIDSVYLRKPPPEKATRRPLPVTEEEDSCGDKCLLFLFRCLDFGLI